MRLTSLELTRVGMYSRFLQTEGRGVSNKKGVVNKKPDRNTSQWDTYVMTISRSLSYKICLEKETHRVRSDHKIDRLRSTKPKGYEVRD